MKVLLYFEGRKFLSRSGLARAFDNQVHMLELAGFVVTTDSKCKDYDLLYVHTYGVHAQVMMKKAKKMGKKIVLYARSTQEDFEKGFLGSTTIAPAYKKYLMTLYQMSDVLLTPTEYSKKLLESYGIKQPIHVLSNGVNLAQYLPNALKENAFREIFNIKKNEKVVISVGHFFERKGIFDFVELAKRMPDVRFMWFGTAPALTISPKVRRVMGKTKPKNVEFPGYIKGDILEGALSASNCFFFPSFEETEGVVVLEALASKQRVLVRDLPAYSSWLTDGVDCLKGKSIDEFEEKLHTILNHPMTEMKEAGYQTARKKNLVEISSQMKQIFETL